MTGGSGRSRRIEGRGVKDFEVFKDIKVEKCGFLQEFANFRTFLYFCVGNNYNTKYYDYYSR